MSPAPPLVLWYERAARELLTEGLPLGNGRLAVLVSGAPAEERILLNEGTLWAGGPHDYTSPDALEALPEVRRLIFEGQYAAAEALAEEKLMGRPKWQPPYQPMGDLFVEFEGHSPVQGYRRELDLESAVARTEYAVAGVRFLREVFVSARDQVLVARFSASQPGALWCSLRLASEQRGLADWQRRPGTSYATGECRMRGRNRNADDIEGALSFEFRALLFNEGGRIMPGQELVQVRNATSLVVVAAAATSYRTYDDLSQDPGNVVSERLDAARGMSFEELRERHSAEYRERFSRLWLEFSTGSNDEERSALPTDARVALYEDGKDPALAALYVQYARYLLLSCSRPGSQPANLQGLWNDQLSPPWGSKCTVNINTEMNYWPALPGALPECSEPLFDLLSDLSESGRRTARVNYGARGWVLHHNVDLWRSSAPVDGAKWGQWPMGGAWLCLHLWDHYRFTLDREMLGRAYPILKGACDFFLDFLVQDERTGHLVTCPSLSPENPHPHGSTLCAGPTMDNAILRDLFGATVEAAQVLDLDPEYRALLESTGERLAPYRVGKGGQLLEWMDDWDLEVPEPQHRHVSHLFGLYPSHQIEPAETPELAVAARRSLELRGDAATGWSLAWKINLWARLCDSKRAHELLRQLLCPERTYTNLFDAHPPFQIDGNFGGAAGVLEMLVQSRPGQLHLLPALPTEWPEGRLTGLRARGGITLDLEWSKGALVRASLTSLVDQELSLRVAGDTGRTVRLLAGRAMSAS